MLKLGSKLLYYFIQFSVQYTASDESALVAGHLGSVPLLVVGDSVLQVADHKQII